MRNVKKPVSLLLIMAMLIGVICVAPFSVSAANTWDPANGVYNISTEADLFAFRDALNADNDFYGCEINLCNNIEISQGTTYESASIQNYGGQAYFFGTFNGHDHTISNLNMVSPGITVSFLPNLGYATIKNLTLSDVTIANGKTYNAAFAARSLAESKIINCHLTGHCLIQSDPNLGSSGNNYTAGIIAQNTGDTFEIIDCSVGEDVTIIGTTNVASNRIAAGILAYIGSDQNNTLISNCVNRANVESSYAASGIVGIINNQSSNSLTIDDCINYGNITSPSLGNGTKYFAGILAKGAPGATVYIDRCANHGDITVGGSSSSGSGGIAGEVACCCLQNSYNTGTVTASDANMVGGIVGQFRTDQIVEPVYTGGTVTVYNPDQYNSMVNCYNTGSVIGGTTDYVGGLCGALQDTSSTSAHSTIVNAYNFGTVSGGDKAGNICAYIESTYVSNTYLPYGTQFIEIDYILPGSADITSSIGYFTSANTDGIIYPATKTIGQSEVISGTPLTGNLLQTLNKWVSDKNAELEADGNNYRYLTWKMTNPASEDGSKGVTVHPMFGVLVEQTLNFHVNEPNAADRLFRVYNGDASTAGAEDTTDYTFTNGGVTAFYDIPAFAGDDYVFAGWYYNSTNGTIDGNTPFEFGSAVPAGVTDVYAHWIAVGTVEKDSDDQKILPNNATTYSGFELFGVQIRPEDKRDLNQEKKMPGGLRYVTSISESLLSSVDALSTQTVNGNKVEYGFVTAKEDTVEAAITKINKDNPGAINKNTYKLQYRGTNVNGVDTIMDNLTQEERATANNFRYVTNVDCTSKVKGYGGNATIKMDHFNSDNNYRLATFVVTYDNASDSNKNIIARAYMRYYDANGLLRTFYNDYDGTYGGCSANYDDINTLLANNNNGIG